MARPEIHDDLPDYTREGHHVFTISEDYLTRYPEIAGHLLAALVDAKTVDLLVTRENGTTKVVKPKSDFELDQALRQAQESWDRREADYQLAVENSSDQRFNPDYVRRWVDQFAVEEGREPISWPTDRVVSA